MMLGVGMKVSFVPCFVPQDRFTPIERSENRINGTIVYINWEHRYFTVEYDCGHTKQRESFKFWHIGKGVTVHG